MKSFRWTAFTKRCRLPTLDCHREIVAMTARDWMGVIDATPIEDFHIQLS